MEKKDNSLRIPSCTSAVSTTGRGWLWGCKAAPRYYCAWLALSMTQCRQYSTRRAWGMNSKYDAEIFFIYFFNLVSFPLMCVLYPSPLCCISFSKLMPRTPPPTGSSRQLGRCGVLIAQPLFSVNLVAQGCSNTFPSGFSLLWGPMATLGVPSSFLELLASGSIHHLLQPGGAGVPPLKKNGTSGHYEAEWWLSSLLPHFKKSKKYFSKLFLWPLVDTSPPPPFFSLRAHGITPTQTHRL